MNSLQRIIFRNKYTMNDTKAIKNRVNLEYWNRTENIGDSISPLICNWLLNKKNLTLDSKTKSTKHLLAVGSILVTGRHYFDATVWGSGILYLNHIRSLSLQKYFRKLDVRVVRGPISAKILSFCGYKCPEIYGDPGVLMPLIYPKTANRNSDTISVIRHLKSVHLKTPDSLNFIDTRTSDYKAFIDQICESKMVISSSLHGIILAESYGVPAIFLQEEMEDSLLKFYDWYYSTNRHNVKIAYSIEEALDIEPMELPDLSDMQENLIKAFPYDLWER
ncbi:MAG: polysaccharide pyruvyl transferase family protein [Lachnospiraceae bacterium]|nr:polysaccharide pyruvyl transferase family protein [Lachnospiraceae bacterium]